MKKKISRAVMDALGGEEIFDASVERYVKALEAHAETEGQPAPAANPIIEDLVANYDGYEIDEPIPLPPKLDVAAQALQDIEMLKGNYEAVQHQMLQMGVAVKEAREWAFFAQDEVKRLAEIVEQVSADMETLKSQYPPVVD